MHRIGAEIEASKKNVVAGAISLSNRRNHRSARNAVEMTASDASRDNNQPFSNDKLRINNVRPSNSSVRINGVETISNDKPGSNNGRFRNNSALSNSGRRNENAARSSGRIHGGETTSRDALISSARMSSGRRRNVRVWNWSVRGSSRISDRTYGAETISAVEKMGASINRSNNAVKLSASNKANKVRNPTAGVDRDNATIQTGNVNSKICNGGANLSIANAGNNNDSSSSATASYSSRDVFSVGDLSRTTGNDNDRISFVCRTFGTTTMAIPIIVTLGKAPITRLHSMVLIS